jgi:hypothetical protein
VYYAEWSYGPNPGHFYFRVLGTLILAVVKKLLLSF